MVHTLHFVNSLANGKVSLTHLFTGDQATLPCGALVVVGHRASVNALYAELAARPPDVAAAGIASLAVTGDAFGAGCHRPCRV